MRPQKPAPSVALMMEDVVGCKWSVTVLGLIRKGVARPSAMEHAVAGLSKKVLNERLRKLVRFGIVQKTVYPEAPPRVEYTLSEFGRRFSTVLDQIERLQGELEAPGAAAVRRSASRS